MLDSKFMLEVDQKSSQDLIKDAQSHLRTTLHVPASLKAWGGFVAQIVTGIHCMNPA